MPSFEEICAQYEVDPKDVVYCFTLSDGTYRLIMKDGFNPVYSVLWDDDADIQISFGGRGSGKSNDMSRRIVATNFSGHNWLVTRYFKVDLKMSCYNEILSVIDDWGLANEYTVDKTTLTITCKHNGRQIIFGALEEPRRLKSIKPKVGVLTDIFMEEADECPSLNAFGMLQACLRGLDREAAKKGLPQPHKRVVLAFNPIVPTHWMHEYFFKPLWHHPDVKTVEELKKLRLKDKVAKGVVDGLKVTMLKTTYADNKFLTAEDIRQRESATGQRMWVDTLGNQGIIGKTVFIEGVHWVTADIKRLTLEGKTPVFDNIRQGVDFGYVNPCAFIKLHLDTHQHKIWVLEEYFIKQVTTDVFAEAIKDKAAGHVVFCDYAEPDRITTLKRFGIAADRCKKGKAKGTKQAVTRRIDWLHNYEIIVDQSCVNLIEELKLYSWEEDAMGNRLEIPKKEYDHGIDAMSYALGHDIFAGNKFEASKWSLIDI